MRKKKDIEDVFAEVMLVHARLLVGDPASVFVDETQAEYLAPMLLVLAGLARRRVIPPEVCEALLDPLDHAEIGWPSFACADPEVARLARWFARVTEYWSHEATESWLAEAIESSRRRRRQRQQRWSTAKPPLDSPQAQAQAQA